MADAVWKLKIGGAWVLDNSTGPFVFNVPPGFSGIGSLKLDRSYDEPSSLAFTLVGNWRPMAYNAGTVVELWRNDVRIFEGKCDLPVRTVGADNSMGLSYVARDRGHDAANDTARTTPEQLPGHPSPRRVPRIELPAGPLEDAVDALLAHVGQDLSRIGMADVCSYVAGAERIECLGIVVEEESIDRAFRKLASAAPGVRCFVDPSDGDPRYTFVNLTAAPVYDVWMDEQVLAKLDIRESIEGCCGAVISYEGMTTGTGQFEFENELRCDRGWDAAKEKHWSERRMGGLARFQGGGDQEELWKVYRCFGFGPQEDITGKRVPRNGDVTALIYRRTDDEFGSAYHIAGERVPILRIDYENRLVYLVEPAIEEDTPSALQCPGVPRRASLMDNNFESTVMLAWNDPGSANVNITIEGIRYPETGFAGRAYAADPIYAGVEKHVEAPPGIDRRRYAAQAFAAWSEPSFSGTLPFNSEPPEEFLLLGRRVNIGTRHHGGTGFEHERAPVMGVTVEFFPAIIAEVQLSRDASTLLSGGLA